MTQPPMQDFDRPLAEDEAWEFHGESVRWYGRNNNYARLSHEDGFTVTRVRIVRDVEETPVAWMRTRRDGSSKPYVYPGATDPRVIHDPGDLWEFTPLYKHASRAPVPAPVVTEAMIEAAVAAWTQSGLGALVKAVKTGAYVFDEAETARLTRDRMREALKAALSARGGAA